MNAPATYQQSQAVNVSTLKAMRRSPLHYLEAVANERRPTKVMGNGIAGHVLTLEPERMKDITVCDIGRETRAWELYEAVRATGEQPAVYDGAVRRGKAWDAFEAAHPGQLIALASEWAAVQPLLGAKQIMTSTELELARAMADAVHAHPEAHRLLQGGRAEVPIYWTDTETGVDCKGRIDYLAPGRVVDLKTTADVSPWVFSRQCARLLTHMQLAFYADGVAGKGQLPDVYVIAVESARPFDVAVYHVRDDTLVAGRDEYRRLLRRLVECVEADNWPGVAPEVIDFELPSWAVAQVDEAEVTLTMGGQAMSF